MKLVIANLKQNLDLKTANDWLDTFTKTPEATQKNYIIAPSFPYLSLFSSRLGKEKISSQNVGDYAQGSYTGQVGAAQIKDFADFCIINHSETNTPPENVLLKIQNSIKNNLVPIICFKDSKTLTLISREYSLENMILCQEDPENISKEGMLKKISQEEVTTLFENLKTQFPNLKILYGGSVNLENSKFIKENNLIDGVIIGHSSLNPHTFSDILRTFA